MTLCGKGREKKQPPQTNNMNHLEKKRDVFNQGLATVWYYGAPSFNQPDSSYGKRIFEYDFKFKLVFYSVG